MNFLRILSDNLFYFSILVSLLHSDCVNKYCSSNGCKNSKQHTLCRFQPGPAQHCVDYERTIKTDHDRQAILHKINVRRNKVAAGEIRSLPAAQDMLKMIWSKELEESAQRWADQCVSRSHGSDDDHDTCRDLENMSVGQNVATVYGEAPGLTPTSLVDVWFMELLNVNSNIVSQYSSPKSFGSSYKYFTQLVWAASYQVGCGGAKFKEQFEESGDDKNRTVYRLVCNFAPQGNKDGEVVYTTGLPGANCTYGTCKRYPALCYMKPPVTKNAIKFSNNREQVEDEPPKNTTDVLEKETSYGTPRVSSTLNTEFTTIIDAEVDNTTFDYFSHLYEFTKQYLTRTAAKTSTCKKDMGIEEIVEILRKKLNDDPNLKEMFTATSSVPTGSVFKDASVAALLHKIYSKTALTTTQGTPHADFVNSTLLVNLVEAVIFRNTDRVQSTERVIKDQEIQVRPHYVNPVRAQAEIAVTPNYDITGHYFFPEDNVEEEIKETTEPDYDISYAPSMQDVVLEIEEIRKNRPTKDFLDEILETDIVMESTTKMKLLSPDDMNLHTSGYSNMRNFLKEIAEKSESHKNEPLVDL